MGGGPLFWSGSSLEAGCGGTPLKYCTPEIRARRLSKCRGKQSPPPCHLVPNSQRALPNRSTVAWCFVAIYVLRTDYGVRISDCLSRTDFGLLARRLRVEDLGSVSIFEDKLLTASARAQGSMQHGSGSALFDRRRGST